MYNKLFSLTQAQLTDTTIGASVANAANTGDEGAGTAGGAFASQIFSAIYTIEVTTAGAYGGTGKVTVTCTTPGATDYGISDEVAPTSGVAFAVGTVGVTLTLTDGGDSTLTLGDKWTIDCSGAMRVIESELSLTDGNYYPRQIGFINNSGAVIGINWVSNGDELTAYIASQTNRDLINIPNSDTLDNWFPGYPKPKAYCVIVGYVSGALSAGITVQCINYSIT